MKLVDKDLKKVSGGAQTIQEGQYTIEVGKTYRAKSGTFGGIKYAKVTNIDGDTVFFDQGIRDASSVDTPITFDTNFSLAASNFANLFSLSETYENLAWNY